LGIATCNPAAGECIIGERVCENDGQALATLLDSTLVGVPVDARGDATSRLKELETFSQHHSASTSSTKGVGAYSQSEVGLYSNRLHPC
jgi:hypothetical protein